MEMLVKSFKSWPISAVPMSMKSQGLLGLFDSTVGSSHNPDGSASKVAPLTERIPKDCYMKMVNAANISTNKSYRYITISHTYHVCVYIYIYIYIYT